jgi:hypothetical protein
MKSAASEPDTLDSGENRRFASALMCADLWPAMRAQIGRKAAKSA